MFKKKVTVLAATENSYNQELTRQTHIDEAVMDMYHKTIAQPKNSIPICHFCTTVKKKPLALFPPLLSISAPSGEQRTMQLYSHHTPLYMI